LAEFEAVWPVILPLSGIIITIIISITGSFSTFWLGNLSSFKPCLSRMLWVLILRCCVVVQWSKNFVLHLPHNLQLENSVFFLIRPLRCSNLLGYFAFPWCSLHGAIPSLF
jgi:hypothetical protein